MPPSCLYYKYGMPIVCSEKLAENTPPTSVSRQVRRAGCRVICQRVNLA